MTTHIQGGLDILRREARGLRRRDRDWKQHNLLMRRAQQHIEACGGDWSEYEGRLRIEFAELMKLI